MRFARLFVCFALLGAAAGCAGPAASVSSTTAEATPVQPVNGPQTRVAVSAFDYKGLQSGDIGQGLAAMLAAALADSGRFVPAAAVPNGAGDDAQWRIEGSFNAFEPACSAGSSIIVSGNQACVSINLKIVDAASGRVVKAINVDGSSDGSGTAQLRAGGELPPGLAAYGRMPMEAAIRSCIDKAVKAIVAAAP